ncbi:histidine kinase [Pontiellaceae bacterium B1224]|nr:histidine kinase [Pontiellaceae bacterium B1224]
MKRITSILYLLFSILYPLFCFEMFHAWNSNVLIPAIPFLAVSAWLIGSTGGLLLVFYIECIAFSLNQFFADEYIYFSDRITGILIALLVVYLFSRLRINYDALRKTTQQLDERVAERDSELSLLTAQLLNNAEIRRVNRGQELHDGIGQQLTGIQLLCASLATQLEQEGSSATSAATSLMDSTCRAHNHIRQIARTLFPVRIAQVGLVSALTELAGCISEMRLTHIQVNDFSGMTDIPETIALQLYRICQESINYLTTHADADRIDISLNASEKHFVLEIEHTGCSPAMTDKDSQLGLIQYRLKQLDGTLKESSSTQGISTIHFNVPKYKTTYQS